MGLDHINSEEAQLSKIGLLERYLKQLRINVENGAERIEHVQLFQDITEAKSEDGCRRVYPGSGTTVIIRSIKYKTWDCGE